MQQAILAATVVAATVIYFWISIREVGAVALSSVMDEPNLPEDRHRRFSPSEESKFFKTSDYRFAGVALILAIVLASLGTAARPAAADDNQWIIYGANCAVDAEGQQPYGQANLEFRLTPDEQGKFQSATGKGHCMDDGGEIYAGKQFLSFKSTCGSTTVYASAEVGGRSENNDSLIRIWAPCSEPVENALDYLLLSEKVISCKGGPTYHVAITQEGTDSPISPDRVKIEHENCTSREDEGHQVLTPGLLWAYCQPVNQPNCGLDHFTVVDAYTVTFDNEGLCGAEFSLPTGVNDGREGLMKVKATLDGPGFTYAWRSHVDNPVSNVCSGEFRLVPFDDINL